MFEAKLAQSSLLKKVLDALRELVEDANLECSSSGEWRTVACVSGHLCVCVCVCVCVWTVELLLVLLAMLKLN